jgi:hypothetical protein
MLSQYMGQSDNKSPSHVQWPVLLLEGLRRMAVFDFRHGPDWALTQELPNQVEAERQQSEWTGRWQCLYHRSAISLKPIY